MGKKMLLGVVAVSIVVGGVGVGMAADCSGVAKAVADTIVTVACDNGKEITATAVHRLEVGDSVKVKAGKARKKEEGC